MSVLDFQGGIIFAGDKLLEGEIVGFQNVGLGLFLYVWHRYRVQTTTESSNE
jgi:hypothetical protein